MSNYELATAPRKLTTEVTRFAVVTTRPMPHDGYQMIARPGGRFLDAFYQRQHDIACELIKEGAPVRGILQFENGQEGRLTEEWEEAEPVPPSPDEPSEYQDSGSW